MTTFKNNQITAILILCLSLTTIDTRASSELLSRLKSLKGIYVSKIETLKGFKESYEIAVVQPIDHNNPNGPKFIQRVFLSHIDSTSPVVFETHGYGVPWHKNRELSSLLNANQIIVEHRYYDASKPKPLNWKYLTVWQAASDHHRIVNILKNIYKGKWISTGKSKGGMAALFLKNYYPDDIDATLTFVAPIFDGMKDQRFVDFLYQVAGESSTKRIKDFQFDCLESRDSMIYFLEKYYENRKIKHSMSLDSILEWNIIEFPNIFWSSNADPAKIPNGKSGDQALFNYLNSISSFSVFSDRYIKSNYPLLWQVVTEFGYYAYDIEHLKFLLKVIDKPDNTCFAPKPKVKPKFNAEVMKDILYYLRTKGNNIIYLYGANDTWTAGKVNPQNTTNSIQIIVKGFGHDFNLKDLTPSDYDLVMNTLKKWIE